MSHHPLSSFVQTAPALSRALQGPDELGYSQLMRAIDDSFRTRGLTLVSANFPPPPDLTLYITKADDQCVAGGGFGDVYRCWYRHAGSPKEVEFGP